MIIGAATHWFGWRTGLGLAGLASLATALVLVPPLIAESPWGGSDDSRPTDAAMIARFTEQRELFEMLARMLEADGGLPRIGADWTSPTDRTEAGVGAARLAEYRRLMSATDLKSLAHFGRGIEFIAYASGLSMSGTAKSYTYGDADDAVERVDGDLDAAAGDRRHVMLWRVIDGRWGLLLDLR